MWKSVESFLWYFGEIFKDSCVPKDTDGFVQEFLKYPERPTGYVTKNNFWEKSLSISYYEITYYVLSSLFEVLSSSAELHWFRQGPVLPHKLFTGLGPWH